MKGLDTNILIRFLTGDDEKQAKIVYEIFKQTENQQTELFIPLLVILEMIWVLESAYKISRIEILKAIKDLLFMPILKFEQRTCLQQLVHEGRLNNYDLSDLLIALSAKEQNCETVLTFDKKAAKSPLFKLAQ